MRHPEHGVIARLGALDPAARDPEWLASPDDLMLRRIMASPRDLESEVSPPRRRRSPMVAASVAALAVVGVGVGVLSWISEPGTAYASWTAEPADTSVQDLWEPSAQCPDVAHEIVTDGDDAQIVEVDLDPVLVDVRGDYTYQLSTDGTGAYAECFVTAGEDGRVDMVTNDTDLGQDSLRPPESGILVLEAGTTSWSEGADGSEGALTAAFGLAAEDVEEVRLATPAGDQVSATVENGWWAAWAPGAESFDPEIVFVVRDGSTQTEQLPEHGNSSGSG